MRVEVEIQYFVILSIFFLIIFQLSLADPMINDSTNSSTEKNSSFVLIIIPGQLMNISNMPSFLLNQSNNNTTFISSGFPISNLFSALNFTTLNLNESPSFVYYNIPIFLNGTVNTGIGSNLTQNNTIALDIGATNTSNIAEPINNSNLYFNLNSSQSLDNLTILNVTLNNQSYSSSANETLNMTTLLPPVTQLITIPTITFQPPGLPVVNSVWAVFRAGDRQNWLFYTSGNKSPDILDSFGRNEDLPVIGDFNGDGIIDRAHFRPREGKWYFDYSFDGTVDKIDTFGMIGEIPVAADFNGDGKTERAMWNENSGKWRIDENMDGREEIIVTFGTKGDVPLSGDVNHDGVCDLIIYRPADHLYLYDYGMDGTLDRTEKFGSGIDHPFVGDFNRDGLLDRGILRAQNSNSWLIDLGFDGTIDEIYQIGKSGDIPFGWGVEISSYQT